MEFGSSLDMTRRRAVLDSEASKLRSQLLWVVDEHRHCRAWPAWGRAVWSNAAVRGRTRRVQEDKEGGEKTEWGVSGGGRAGSDGTQWTREACHQPLVLCGHNIATRQPWYMLQTHAGVARTSADSRRFSLTQKGRP